jgi:hypothetical protein
MSPCGHLCDDATPTAPSMTRGASLRNSQARLVNEISHKLSHAFEQGYARLQGRLFSARQCRQLEAALNSLSDSKFTSIKQSGGSRVQCEFTADDFCRSIHVGRSSFVKYLGFVNALQQVRETVSADRTQLFSVMRGVCLQSLPRWYLANSLTRRDAAQDAHTDLDFRCIHMRYGTIVVCARGFNFML